MSGKRNAAKAAVIQFPGVNCEYESARALRAAGANPRIIRWNEDPAQLADFDLFLLPGGFSYQDRVRAGSVAAKEEILSALSVEVAKGKPVIGICNGAQVLVEAGFVPGLSGESIELALAPNRMRGREGYFTDWSTLRVAENSPSWLSAMSGKLLPMPFAHGEGRFTSRREGLFAELAERGQIVLRYADQSGAIAADWPLNPNGSEAGAAGICNPAGNVLALMPHPERAACLGHVPETLGGHWGEKRLAAAGDWRALRGPGPGHALFSAMIEAALSRKEASRAV